MHPFLHAHATHADWHMALALAQAQLEGQWAATLQRHRDAPRPTLGWVYLTDHYASHAEALLASLQSRWPGVSWIGAVGVGIAASGVEYFDEPALALMLGALPREHFRVFSGAQPLAGGSPTPGSLNLGLTAHAAQVHADSATPDLAELIAEMSDRTATGYLFGGLASGRHRPVHIADGVFQGGLSGVAFGSQVGLVSRVTQGCQPIGPVRRISACERNIVTGLDGGAALDSLMIDLRIDLDEPRRALPALRQTLVGLSDGRADALSRPGQFGTDTRVRHLVGIDPQRKGIAIGDVAEAGMQLAFCQRNTEAARRDLVRICAEIREELSPDEASTQRSVRPAASDSLEAPRRSSDDSVRRLLDDAMSQARRPEPSAPGQRADAFDAPLPGGSERIAGAIYVSCAGRGGPHFGAPNAELAIIRHALGDVPLVGFFANGEIARHHLYGYTGVLTVFTR